MILLAFTSFPLPFSLPNLRAFFLPPFSTFRLSVLNSFFLPIFFFYNKIIYVAIEGIILCENDESSLYHWNHLKEVRSGRQDLEIAIFLISFLIFFYNIPGRIWHRREIAFSRVLLKYNNETLDSKRKRRKMFPAFKYEKRFSFRERSPIETWIVQQ